MPAVSSKNDRPENGLALYQKALDGFYEWIVGMRGGPMTRTVVWLHPTGRAKIVALLSTLAILVGCAGHHSIAIAHQSEESDRSRVAIAMFAERCKKAGEFIHRRVEGVEGIFLLKVRPRNVNYGDQFVLDDPYGHDLGGDGYIGSFLRGSHGGGMRGANSDVAHLLPKGYLYVEAIDPKDGIRYRYTGSLEEPWIADKRYLEGYLRFVMRRTPSNSLPLYGITYDDISTREEREHWIAGSSLRIVNLQTKEILAERIGYAIDLAQGSSAGNRSPWLWALENACPPVLDKSIPRRAPVAASAANRAARFAESVLHPKD